MKLCFLANSLPKATIIVSENRIRAILKAKELGCKIIFLDDGFSKYKITNLIFYLDQKDEPTNIFVYQIGWI